MEKIQYVSCERIIAVSICFVMALMVFVTVPVEAQQTEVRINTPEWVEGTTVYAILEINNVGNLDSGQFDLSFDSSVLKVVNVEDGSIEGTKIPVQWRLIDADTIKVIFNLEGVTGITGSGQLAKIGFEVTGHGDSTLDISKGLLVDTEANEISTNWGINTAKDEYESTPGFEAVIALMGLIVISYLFFSRK